MNGRSAIRVGSGIGVGSITVEPLLPVYGEGGPHNGRLVVRLVVTMQPQPLDRMLALQSLTCSLHLSSGNMYPGTHNQLGMPIVHDLAPSFPCRSLPDGTSEQIVELRFPISEAQLALVERYRHAQPEASFVGSLKLTSAVAWLAKVGNTYPSTGAQVLPHPFDSQMGMLSLPIPFWTTTTEDLTLSVPASLWVQKVLPGLGLDRLRLIEIALPQVVESFPDTLISHFDAARLSFDTGHYRECMVQCRDIRNAVEQHLGATKQHPMGDVVEDRLHLPPGSQQRELLNAVWGALAFETNVAPHLPGGPHITEMDARACLHLTALALEYLGGLLQ